MVREIIKPENEIYQLHIPKEYINKRIEILILPFSYNEEKKILSKNNEDIFFQAAGILKNKNIDPLKWQNEIRNEWK
ncbi:hypothetical protein ACOL3B_08450 [Aliarcobacter butzleri]|uniref:hypothetical protein n=1 Tax=Aliarcobacter butzleri TaxID=28197 RepID=UPI00189FCF83|nr:hypothetical protein [Aliarcobacter butzleri]MBF7065914.1 hypothetical protein [Aliarcobacter butzleri]MCG3702297.1 hypothetical protein [Aliarcobacter butzleri]MDN5112555.1 hypothetical protein [Aliarcobacter butzleri]